jgi:fibronectin-binding autotransporter adhesin
MHNRNIAPLLAAAVFWTLLASATLANAQTLTWGVNGAGGSGNWDTTTADWFNGSQNVVWSSNGNAIFGGASGGTVSSFSPGPLVASMTFNTPEYVIQGGQIQTNSNGLTVTTNVDATIGSTLFGSGLGNSLVKNGPATLVLNGSFFLGIQLNQGEIRIAGSSSFFASNVVLADAPDVVITLGPSSSSASVGLLGGGGTTGGVIRPDNQPRTVTLDSTSTTTSMSGVTFGGVLEDNGGGVLAMAFDSGLATQTLINANTYSGATAVTGGTLIFSGNGTALNSSAFSISPNARLLLDDSGTVVADRISETNPISIESGTIQLKGNTSVPVEEKLGQLTISGVPKLTTQPQTAAAQLTFAGIQRNGHATITVSGPGIELVGLSNVASGIAPAFITFGNNWATVGADGRLAPLTSYASDINSGATTDNVKLTSAGTTSLAAATTRGSLDLQNNNTTQILDLSGQTLGLTSGGILATGGGSSTISDGALSTTAGEVVVTTNNNLAIAASIADGGVATALTKTGAATLTLSGSNTYTGETTVMQGTLVVSSDSNLGLGSTVDLNGGNGGASGVLMAAANFSSSKGVTNTTSTPGDINTAGFNVTFSGPVTNVNKLGLGTLTLSTPVVGKVVVNAGTLVLPNVTSGSVSLLGGALQASGTLTLLSLPVLPSAKLVLDIGGPAAANLTTNSFFSPSPNNLLTVEFGLGGDGSDLWTISSGGLSRFPLNSDSLQFEFSNLGGVMTGVDYPLISYSGSAFAQPASAFAFAPDMAAAGWSGTFISTSSGVSVMFTSVPEPSVTALMFLQGALLIWAARRRLQNAGGRIARSADADIAACEDVKRRGVHQVGQV